MLPRQKYNCRRRPILPKKPTAPLLVEKVKQHVCIIGHLERIIPTAPLRLSNWFCLSRNTFSVVLALEAKTGIL